MKKTILLLMIIIIISGCQPTKLTIDCSELGDEDEQAYCQRWVDKCEGKDDSMCDKFMGQLYLASAMEHKDHNYCAEINTEVGRDDCYFRLNTYRANAALCDKIKKESSKENCKKRVPTVLNPVTIEDIPKIYLPEIKLKDFKLSDKTEYGNTIEAQGSGYSVIGGFSFASLNPLECEKFKEIEYKAGDLVNVYDECFEKLAQITGDYTICKNLQETTASNECLSEYANYEDDARACFDIVPLGPNDLKHQRYNDDDYYRLSISRCLYYVIISNPTKEGCDILGNTLNGQQEYERECLRRI